MWAIALLASTIAWVVFGIFLVYSTGTLFLQGNFHQFFLALLFWALSNIAVVAFTALS